MQRENVLFLDGAGGHWSASMVLCWCPSWHKCGISINIGMGYLHLYVFLNIFMFWIDELKVIISLALMSLTDVGSFYWMMCLIVLFPHYYKNEKNLLLLKWHQHGLGLGNFWNQRDLTNEENALNNPSVTVTLQGAHLVPVLRWQWLLVALFPSHRCYWC